MKTKLNTKHMFNIDFDIVVRNLLPPVKRKQSILDFIKSMNSPLKDAYYNFLDWRLSNLEKLAYSGQVIYLEHLLNKEFYGDVFNATGEKVIFITNNIMLREHYFFNDREGKESNYMFNIEGRDGQTDIEKTVSQEDVPQLWIVDLKDSNGDPLLDDNNKPVTAELMYYFSSGEYDSEMDFTIWYPNSTVGDILPDLEERTNKSALLEIIERYRQAGKQYELKKYLNYTTDEYTISHKTGIDPNTGEDIVEDVKYKYIVDFEEYVPETE